LVQEIKLKKIIIYGDVTKWVNIIEIVVYYDLNVI
jgi:hypothetical protein